MTKLGMIIDTAYCIGCNACTEACKQEQGTPPDVMFARVNMKESGKYPNVKKQFLPLLCMHCEKPACMESCPSHAISKTPEGIVVVNEDKCCGAQACVSACPYGAIYYPTELKTYFQDHVTPYENYHIRKRINFPVAMKCNLCQHRVKDGKEPACVVSCPTECRIFGDWDDPKSKLYSYLENRREKEKPFALRAEAGTKPKVLYLSDRKTPKEKTDESLTVTIPLEKPARK